MGIFFIYYVYSDGLNKGVWKGYEVLYKFRSKIRLGYNLNENTFIFYRNTKIVLTDEKHLSVLNIIESLKMALL